MLRPKQPIRPHQQDQQNDHERRDVLESIDDVGVDVPAGDRLDDPDGDTAEDGAGDAVQSSQDHGGQALSPTKPSAKFTPSHNPNRIPPTAPAIEAKAQAYAKTRRRLTPRVLAVNWSFAAARIAIPTSE